MKLKSRHIHKRYIILLLACAVFISAIVSGCGDRTEETAVVNGTSGQADSAVDYIYGIPMDENAGVVKVNVADVYAGPDVKSARVTQALYNQPVSISRSEGGWSKVTTVDGCSGWMKTKHIDRDVSSIYGRTYTHRIIITSREKSIYSDPTGGVTVAVAPMGSEFYAFNNYDDAYEVFLPGKKTGWLKGSGIIHVKLDEVIPVTNADDFAATALRMKGVSYLLNGLSAMGIDAPGLVYICARINGINLPRTLAGQFNVGIEIEPEAAKAGDLVFMAGTGEGESEKVSCVGICIGDGSYIYAGRKIGYVAIGDINRENEDGIVIAAKRIFNVTDD
ncbi:MAG: NlpC/P60 family protein [Bacillota bacterium]